MSKKFAKMVSRTLYSFLCLIFIICGAIQIININNKIVTTSIELIIIRDDIAYYNQYIPKNNITENDYYESCEKREKIYNSDDYIIRKFSNKKLSTKLSVLSVVLLMYPIILLVIISETYYTYLKVKKLIRITIIMRMIIK